MICWLSAWQKNTSFEQHVCSPLPALCRPIKYMRTTFDAPREETKLLPAPALVKALLAQDSSVNESVFSMLALYGGGDAHAEATDFTSFLANQLAPDLEVQTSEWSFEELDHLRPGTVSTELAEQTDVLLLDQNLRVSEIAFEVGF
jgi:hypothetical protein